MTTEELKALAEGLIGPILDCDDRSRYERTLKALREVQRRTREEAAGRLYSRAGTWYGTMTNLELKQVAAEIERLAEEDSER